MISFFHAEKCELNSSGSEVKPPTSPTPSSGGGGADGSSAAAAAAAGSPEAMLERHGGSFRMGYRECLSETMHFLVEKEGRYQGDALCERLMAHLQAHFSKLNKGKKSF